MANAVATITISPGQLGAMSDALKRLDENVRNRIINKALDAGAAVVSAAAQRHMTFEDRSGRLRTSIGRKRYKSRRRNRMGVVIGPRSDRTFEFEGGKVNPGKYAHLVEFGHRIVPPFKHHRFSATELFANDDEKRARVGTLRKQRARMLYARGSDHAERRTAIAEIDAKLDLEAGGMTQAFPFMGPGAKDAAPGVMRAIESTLRNALAAERFRR